MQSGMKRRELETTLKAAGRVAHEVEFFLIGTQAVMLIVAGLLRKRCCLRSVTFIPRTVLKPLI